MSWFAHHRYFYLCLDPVHVGAGGYRLGRVDNTIVREPGTNVPKVPGTSLSGAARSYAAMLANRIEAAGLQTKLKGKKDYKKCPILYTFGTASDDVASDQSKAGAVSFSDANIVFFPVTSTLGPLWVTTPALLRSAGLNWEGDQPDDEGKVVLMRPKPPAEVNAGWLLFPTGKGGKWIGNEKHALVVAEEWKDIFDRVLVVAPRYFSIIVNSNLEVRTSVSINPETGAAEDKHLFTYEAIPRGTWLAGDVVVDDFGREFPKAELWNPSLETRSWTDPIDVAKAGLKLIEYLGVGGMGTRGFGRMCMIAEQELRGRA